MRKIYFIITVGLLTFSAIFISYYTQQSEKSIFASELTPKEIWQKQYQKKKARRKHGYNKADKPDMYSKYFKAITTPIGESESGYQMNYTTLELQKARMNAPKLKSTKAVLNFIQRGPANVGGRTRAIIVDPDVANKNTWYAGSATGGIWKTTDGAETWSNISKDLSNLSVNALAMAPSNHDIIYAGTGESFPGSAQNFGNGIWKSVDRGASWNQLASTSADDNFAYINRFFVNPVDENIVLAATEEGIFKTSNGGINWDQVYESKEGVEDLSAYTYARDTIFAGENSNGILRTTDGGDNWELHSKGLALGNRYEVAVSPVNRNIIFTSVDISVNSSSVFISRDNAETWHRFNDDINLLGGQGVYDNTIEAHPFNENEVFVGGVNLWQIAFNGDIKDIKKGVKAAYTENADFLSFGNFGGSYLSGGLSIKKGTNLSSIDWNSVEIRFGKGLSQKAHRFTVPTEETSGVPPASYTYEDYVDVPFQVWDVTNNLQLMVSFRDQEMDGEFNLYETTGEEYGSQGREYIFIHAQIYKAQYANTNVAVSGGHLYKSMYVFWPELVKGATWDAENLPDSKIVVEYGSIEEQQGVISCIADAYGEYGGANSYKQRSAYGDTKIPGLHPDHHNITILPLDAGNFRIINGNDGGIGVSDDNGLTFIQKPNNYITTQFYGVAKNPDANEYIGGMQDNGTWQSAEGDDASSSSHYYFRLGGDGFECLWHSEDSQKLLGSIYNNQINRSKNGGETWSKVEGISAFDGPFITRLSDSKWHPDVVFAVGGKGVYKSTDFGANWELKTIETTWASGGVSSQHNVEVSLADPNIVWAGAQMSKNGVLKIHVSQDEGETYTAVSEYAEKDMNAWISGIATHPKDPSTAYLLFSNRKSPKILRTIDMGLTWQDISGFGTGKASTNGFPDVVTQCLLVMPHAPNTIWAGTEIGLFESINNGQTWHAVTGNMPPVSIYDMHIVGNQVIFATHGRGIWSVDIPEIDRIPLIEEFKEVADFTLNLNIDLKVKYDSLEVYLNGNVTRTIQNPEQATLSIPITVAQPGVYDSYLMAYIGEDAYKSNEKEVEVMDKTPVISEFELIEEYKLNIQMDIAVEYDSLQLILNDEKYKTIVTPSSGTTNIKVSVENEGVYNAQLVGYLFDTPFYSNIRELDFFITGIAELPQETFEFMIYPNPCRGEFKLQLNSLYRDYSLEIFNIKGQKVYSQKNRNSGVNIVSINELKSGLYIVRVTLEDEILTRKIQIIN